MKNILPCVLTLLGASLAQADIIESISFNLGDLNPGSTLSGTFALPNSPTAGDTASVALTFSDPSDYSPTSIMGTITIGSGTFLPYTVDFSVPNFTDLNGTLSPINTREVDLAPFGMAQCASFPCTATGGLQDNSPAVFTSTYTITAVPEPGYSMIIPILLVGFVFGKRFVRAA
jgi:hypothetical protein